MQWQERERKKKDEVAQLCPTLCDPMDCSLPGSSVQGILQARVLQWVSIFFPRRFPDPGIKPGSPALQADALPSEPPGKSGGRRGLKQKPRVHVLACMSVN